MKRIAKRVLLIGWDSADWKIINPLMDAGQMPALQSLIERGVCGNIATLDPPLSPMLWTSIATGKRPHKHGILGFLEPDAAGTGLRQTHVTSRKVKAIWNILNQEGLRSNVVGWWPSHPAEPVNGTVVSNFYQSANFGQSPENWPLQKGCVHPENQHDLFASLRVHPRELTEAHILPFIPEAARIDQTQDGSLLKLTKQLAECASIHNAATYILENDPDFDLMGVYYEAPDMVSHSFMKYHPPRMDHIDVAAYELYKDVVNGIYRFHDMMLERLLQLVPEDTTVILLSDHGFHSDHLRPRSLPKEPAAIAIEHAPYGIFVACGPNIKKDERIYGAGILDITPTLLTLFGLPVAQDMDGKPLLQIFEEPVTPGSISSWEYVDGTSGQHPPELKADLYEVRDEKALQQLADLGYIEQATAENPDEHFRNNIRENRFYLARSYYNAKEYNPAIAILEELVAEKPAKERYLRYLVEAQLKMNNTTRCRELLQELLALNDNKKGFGILMTEGQVLMHEGKTREAIDCFEAADSMSRDAPYSRLPLGNAYLKSGRPEDAEKIFRKELETNPNSHIAHYGLGLCSQQAGKHEDAIDHLLDSIGLLYFNPAAHFHLGNSFLALALYTEAAQAYETALRLEPRMAKARAQLEKVYKDHLNDEGRYKQLFEAHTRQAMETVYIVSGLPRSGTSMMMQMLEAGGLSVFTDNLRTADDNNRKGYYEHEAVKIIHQDNTWMKQAVGKTVKVVSHLLRYLPKRYQYKIVFMERDLNEVLDSQHKMLQNLGKIPENTVHFSLEENFRKNLETTRSWLEDQDNTDVLYIRYQDALNDTEAILEKLNAFFGGKLDTDAMRRVVDRALYRSQAR